MNSLPTCQTTHPPTTHCVPEEVGEVEGRANCMETYLSGTFFTRRITIYS